MVVMAILGMPLFSSCLVLVISYFVMTAVGTSGFACYHEDIRIYPADGDMISDHAI